MISHPHVLCTGCQDSLIRVYDAHSLFLDHTLSGHKRGVWCLQHQGTFLFSVSRDCVCVWDVSPHGSFALLWTIPMPAEKGKPFCACVDSTTVYVGTQSTLVLALTMPPELLATTPSLTSATPRPAKRLRLELSDRSDSMMAISPTPAPAGAVATFSDNESATIVSDVPAARWTTLNAHRGYVHGLVADAARGHVYSAGGEGRICQWKLPGSAAPMSSWTAHAGSVTALVLAGDLYSAGADATVKVWDLESLHCKHVLQGHRDEVVCLAASPLEGASYSRIIASGAADSTVRVWSCRTYMCLAVLTMPSSLMAVTVSCSMLVACGTDHVVRTWDIRDVFTSEAADAMSSGSMSALPSSGAGAASALSHRLRSSLQTFVGIPSVSSDPHRRSDCWAAAKFVQSLFAKLGADCRLVPTTHGSNPVVLGRFGWTVGVPTVVVYGHYDVQPADEDDGWRTHPFTLSGQDGYYYGRGVSDNKGPLLAAMFAAAHVTSKSRDSGFQSLAAGFSVDDALSPPPSTSPAATNGGADGAVDGTHNPPKINVAFVIEGEGEHGSSGFIDAVKRELKWFQGATLLMNNNNTWLGEDVPCLTYSLRGRIEFTIKVLGGSRDMHSGVDGGAVVEPLADLSAVLASFLNPGTSKVAIPGFHDSVIPLSPEETALAKELHYSTDTYCQERGLARMPETDAIAHLVARWRTPSLSIHTVHSSANNSSVIAHWASALVTVRTVPGQDPNMLIEHLKKHCMEVMAGRRTNNQLEVKVNSVADWWLGNPHSTEYKAAAGAIERHWGMKPHIIGEGGTMANTPALSKLLNIPAIHVPLGQSSDSPHLQNERMRAKNYFIGAQVIGTFLQTLASSTGAATAAAAGSAPTSGQ